jgi:small subunit ribosomal protein S16
MALKIRLTRTGAIHNPYYRVVVAEARSRRDGAPVEQLGTYAPCDKANQLNLKLDRIDYWLSKGAKPTDTLNSLIKKARKALAPAVEATPVAEEVSA